MAERSVDLAIRQCRQTFQKRCVAHTSPCARTFSSNASRRKQGSLPTFTTTSTPELDTLLSTLRSKVFLPSHVRLAQRNLMFRTRHHAMLRAEPISIELGAETIQLTPIDQTRDVPDSWKSVLRAMALMGESGPAWRNLPALLAGMHTAGRRWRPWQWEKIVRTAGEHGQVRAVVEAVRQAQRTGLLLRDVRIVREVMWACRACAVLAGWEERETRAALRYAEQVAEFLEEAVHLGGPSGGVGLDPRTQEDVIGVVLELAAARALRHTGAKDEDGKVLRYAQRLMPNMRKAKVEEVQDGEGLFAARADYELMRWVPVMEGLRLAREVLGDEMPRKEVAKRKTEELASKLNDLKGFIVAAQEETQEKRRGLRWLETTVEYSK